MSTVDIGKKAPQFTLQGTAGEWSLRDAAGGTVVIYFYPRDNTPGCTQEGEDFSAAFAQFKKAKAVILGISPDTVASHEKFKKKNGVSVRAAERSRSQSVRAVRRDPGKEHVWEEIHGGSNAAPSSSTPRECCGTRGAKSR